MNKQGHRPHSGNKPSNRPNKVDHHIHTMGVTPTLESLYDKGVQKSMCSFITNFFKKKPDQSQLVVVDSPGGDLVAQSAATKFYVGVGINSYSNAPLNGCVNDIEDVFGLLTAKYRFKQGDSMRLLCDSRATKKEIMNRLAWLVSVAKPGDVCLFNYSGHGAQLPNRKVTGEVDGIDECLCPVDFDWSTNYIIDDQLGQIADSISKKGALPIFLIDACHSGTILRDMPKKIKKYIRNRLMPIPVDIRARIKSDIKHKTLASTLAANSNAILIAGCLEGQTSADAYFKGRYNGALTYNIVKILSKTPDITYAELESKLATALRMGGFAQTPVIVASADNLNRKVFN